MMPCRLEVCVLVVGFWCRFVAPAGLSSPPGCNTVSPPPAGELVRMWAAFKPDSLAPADTTVFYDLGLHGYGDTVTAGLVAARVGAGSVSFTARRQNSDAWGCWSTWLPVYADTINVAGDFNGDGQVDVSDLAVFAELQSRGSPLSWPAPTRP